MRLFLSVIALLSGCWDFNGLHSSSCSSSVTWTVDCEVHCEPLAVPVKCAIADDNHLYFYTPDDMDLSDVVVKAPWPQFAEMCGATSYRFIRVRKVQPPSPTGKSCADGSEVQFTGRNYHETKEEILP